MQACGGIGYLGRTAIFELLVVGDAVRKALTAEPEARRAAPGRPQGRHEEPPGGRRLAGGQRSDLVARIDARVETVE